MPKTPFAFDLSNRHNEQKCIYKVNHCVNVYVSLQCDRLPISHALDHTNLSLAQVTTPFTLSMVNQSLIVSQSQDKELNFRW